MRPEDNFCHLFPPANLKIMSDSLEKAKELAQDGKVKKRLVLVDAEFRLLKAKAGACHMYRAYGVAPSWETLNLVEAQVKAYRDTLASFKTDQKEFAGFRKPYCGGADSKFEFVGRKVSAPLGWNFDEIRKSKKLPAIETSMEMRGASGLAPYKMGDGRKTVDKAGKVSAAPAATLSPEEKEKLFNEKLGDGKTPADQ